MVSYKFNIPPPIIQLLDSFLQVSDQVRVFIVKLFDGTFGLDQLRNEEDQAYQTTDQRYGYGDPNYLETGVA